MAGLLAGSAEAMYFAGMKETSWPVIAASVVSILLGGLPTLRKGWVALRTLTLNINFLMTVAIIGGAVIGAWPEIALVTFLFALAELIEKKALDRARNAVKGLMAMTPDEANECVVLNCCVTDTNDTPCVSNTSTSFEKSVSDRLRRSTL